MNELNPIGLWGIILVGMVVTYATRILFITFIPQDRLPQLIRRSLHYVPPSVLAALILPELLLPEGHLDLSFSNHRLLAGIFASVIAWRTENAWLTIIAGMGALWLLVSI